MPNQKTKMEHSVQDQRVQRTYRALKGTLEKLLCENTFEQLTVQQICQEAGIRRTTFYQHFQDKQDFMAWFIREKQQEFSSGSTAVIPPEDLGNQFVMLAMRVMDYVRQNEKLVCALVNAEINGQRLLDVYIKTCVEELTRRLEDVPELEKRAGDTPLPFLAEFYIGGMISAFRWWILNGKPCSEEDFLRYLRLRVERMTEA